MKTSYAILAGLTVASMAQAQSITVINQGFELPGIAKTEYWDATGAIIPGIIPGWEPSGPGAESPGGPAGGPGDSGVESDATYGSWRGYLSGLDPSIYQTTAYAILGTEPGFTLTIAAKDSFTGDTGYGAIQNSSVLNMSLYYLDGGNRVSLGNQDFTMTTGMFGPFADYTFNVLSIPGAAVGKLLGIELDNVSDLRDLGGDVVHAWQGLDNVRLSVIPEPATAALLGFAVAGLVILRRRKA